MFHQELHESDRIEGLIVEALREILGHEDPDRFLRWARERFPEVLTLTEPALSSVEVGRVVIMLAAAIWNATPLPSRDFGALPLLAPDTSCPCDSGQSFDSCCGRTDELPDLSRDVLWELLLDELNERDLLRALHLAVIPDHLLAKVADRWLDLDRPGRAIALVEPLFANLDEATGDSARFVPALESLCDAYDRLDHWKKKRTFLARMTGIGARALRGAAWRRLSADHMDAGAFDVAHEAFIEALRQTPDDPALAFLEIALLTAQYRDDEARRRAQVWRHRLIRAGRDDLGTLAFLELALDDPQEALVASQAPALDSTVLDLREWLDQIAGRPLPHYRLAALASNRTEVPANQLELFEARETPSRPLDGEIRGTAARLRPGRTLRRLEEAWHRVFPAVKPFSTQLALIEDDSIWATRDWVDFLLRHPEAGDSLDVLDDVATAILSHPESVVPWFRRALLPPLLARAQAIIEQAVPGASRRTIPWTSERNRPALRLLFRLYLQQVEAGERNRAAATLEDLLRLNPRDNHGVRADLMNLYLRDRQDRKALALARRFPDDRLADLAYGEVLALYRLGEAERAAQVLDQAVGRLPSIPAYLTRQRIKPPNHAHWSMPPGGDDQAWLYREAMRDVWVAEPGVLAWLKRMTA
ncbi:hypothetical protein ABC977_11485 [Thioalkalicoccus limnaeus]|uniref:Zinc chelation protein SecC n=1 Tax=Thioalkalicoccus limnaeus TaxID=120681 RepID=A0ABV4BEQ7_9GAMM